MTPKEAAIDLIKVYVERGDDIRSLRAGQMGVGGGDYDASIGGAIFPEEYMTFKRVLECPKNLIKKVSTDKILVRKVKGKIINETFSLEEIFNLIKNKKPLQLTLI